MPDLLTHTAFGEDVLLNIKNNHLRNIIQENKKLFLIGAQGPDLFFYYNFYKKNKTKIGQMMHAQHTGEFLVKMCESISNIQGKEYQELMSYFFGFVCHYVLDKNTHPFIFCFSGFNFENGLEKGTYDKEHSLMENCIDAYMWQKTKNKEAYKEPAYRLIDLRRSLPDHICHYLNNNIYDVYGINFTDKEVNKAYRHFVLGWKLLYDPFNIKKMMVKILIKLRGKPIQLPKHFYPKDIKQCMKYLNLENNSWGHPLDSKLESNQSFVELYQFAVNECVQMVQALYSNIINKEKINPNIIGKQSYLSNFIWDSEKNLVKVQSQEEVESCTGCIPIQDSTYISKGDK